MENEIPEVVEYSFHFVTIYNEYQYQGATKVKVVMDYESIAVYLHSPIKEFDKIIHELDGSMITEFTVDRAQIIAKASLILEGLL